MVRRIFLADDHDVVRHGLRLLLEEEPGWKVCGEARNGRDAVDMIRTLRPDVAILDVEMPEMNGLEAARQIGMEAPGVELLIFTMHESDELVAQVFAAGARGYLVKPDAPRFILAAVEALLAHQPFLSSRMTGAVIDAFLRDRPAADEKRGCEAPTLTGREREIIQLLAEGCRNKDIARRLGVSSKTVETHRAAIMRKIDAASIVDLVRYAVRNRIASA